MLEQDEASSESHLPASAASASSSFTSKLDSQVLQLQGSVFWGFKTLFRQHHFCAQQLTPLWSWHHSRVRLKGLLHTALQQAGDKCSSLALGWMLSTSQGLLTWLDLPKASRTPDHQQHLWGSAILGLEKVAGSLFLRKFLNLQHLQDPSSSNSPKNSVGKVTGQPCNSFPKPAAPRYSKMGSPKAPPGLTHVQKPPWASQNLLADAAEMVPNAELDARAMV